VTPIVSLHQMANLYDDAGETDIEDIVEADEHIDSDDEQTNEYEQVNDDELINIEEESDSELDSEYTDSEGDSEYDPSEIDNNKNKLFQLNENSTDDESTIILVKSEDRLTSEHMTNYEYSKVIGIRATHISDGSPIFTDVVNLTDPRDIAKKEINENVCPLSITRKLRNGKIEQWTVNELIKPNI